MSEQEEDFAAMFEASVKARQFDRGQTIEGTIVAFGPKVAFVNVGGKGEAEIDLAELKDADGDVEVSVGDRIQAMVVSTSGGIVLSRRGVRNAATQRELEDAFQAGLAVEGKVEKVVKGGYEVRIARERAFCPLSQIDIVRTADPAVHEGQTYTFRIIEYKDGGKDIVVSRRKHLEEQQRASAADVRKSIVPGAVLAGRVASVPDVRRLRGPWRRHPGPAPCVRNGLVARHQAERDRRARRSDHREGAACGRRHAEDLARAEAAPGRSVDHGGHHLRGGPGAHGPRHARGGLRRVRGAGAGHRRVGARFHVCPDGSHRRLGEIGGRGLDRGVRDPEHRHRAEAHRRRARRRRVLAGRGSAVAAGRDRARRDRDRQGGASREVRRVRVPVAGAHRLDPVAETGVDRDVDMLKAFPIGSDVEVVVLEVDPAGRRIRLSKKAVAEQREQAELREYAARPDAAPNGLAGIAGRQPA